MSIQELRRKAGLSVCELSKRVGVNKNTVYNYEKGGIPSTIVEFIEMSKIYGCSFDDLIIPDNMKKMRKKAGFSAKDISKTFQMAKDSVWNYEKGEFPNTVKTFNRMAAELKCTVEDLIPFDITPPEVIKSVISTSDFRDAISLLSKDLSFSDIAAITGLSENQIFRASYGAKIRMNAVQYRRLKQLEEELECQKKQL
jgi:transcriptional regulator with XRE-family HTH domain